MWLITDINSVNVSALDKSPRIHLMKFQKSKKPTHELVFWISVGILTEFSVNYLAGS
jgi:hypothetical protein